MPCRYVIDKERRLVISTCWGRVTYEEMKAHDDQLEKDEDFNPEFDQLADMRNVSTLAVSAEQGKTLARRYVFSHGSRRAWVASDPAVYGMGRLMATHYEIGLNSSNGLTFYDLPSALKWLGVSDLSVDVPPGNPKS